MRIRRRTFWFRVAFGGVASCAAPRADHMKHTLSTRTMRGYWGEWWS